MDVKTVRIDPHGITVAILAGGLGTRLRCLVPSQPKAMASVCNRPFLSFLFESLLTQGFQRAVVCTGYLGEQVREHFRNAFGQMKIAYSQEEELKGTAGALRQALPQIETKYVLAINGDSYCAADLKSYLKWYFQCDAEISLLLTHVKDVRRYGSVQTDVHEQVVGFHEKPVKMEGGYISAGIYLLRCDHIAVIPDDRKVSLEHEFLPRYVGKGLFGFKTRAPFLDIGTPETFQFAQTFFKHWPELPAEQ